MALSTARIHRVRGRPPLLAAGIISLIHSHSSSVRSLGYIFSFIYPFYTTHEDFSDRLLDIIGDSVYLLYANLYDLTRQTARVRGRDRPDARRVCASPAGFCCGLCRTLSVRQDLARQGAPTPERWRRQRRFAAYGRQAVLHPGLPEDQSAANDARVAIRAESTAEPLLDSSLAPCPETCLSRARRGAGTRCEPGRH